MSMPMAEASPLDKLYQNYHENYIPYLKSRLKSVNISEAMPL